MTVPVLLAGVVGAVVGMLGGGGSILLLPVLVYAAHLAAPEAITLSLLVVAITSLSALPSHARAGYVDVRAGLIVGAGGMLGALVGARLSALLPDAVLLAGFAVLMVATALRMLRSARAGACADDVDQAHTLSSGRALLLGAAVGAVSGLVGAGGGFLVVPTLVFVGGLAIRSAIGTSLLVIALQSSAGFAMHLHHATLPLGLSAWVSAVAVLGSVLGSLLSRRVPQARLRRGFAWLVLAGGVAMLLAVAAQSHAPAEGSALQHARWTTHRAASSSIAHAAAIGKRSRPCWSAIKSRSTASA